MRTSFSIMNTIVLSLLRRTDATVLKLLETLLSRQPAAMPAKMWVCILYVAVT